MTAKPRTLPSDARISCPPVMATTPSATMPTEAATASQSAADRARLRPTRSAKIRLESASRMPMAGSRSAAAMCSMGAVSTRSGGSDGRRVHGRVDHGAKPYPVASSRVVTAVLRAQRR